ncbi:hypothetical protein B0H21DRAFT_87754 [Amylocystis lapponica]|nr:hypothetical protein B0H21DRAFT_87754 [Amylocystis lapponica]
MILRLLSLIAHLHLATTLHHCRVGTGLKPKSLADLHLSSDSEMHLHPCCHQRKQSRMTEGVSEIFKFRHVWDDADGLCQTSLSNHQYTMTGELGRRGQKLPMPVRRDAYIHYW